MDSDAEYFREEKIFHAGIPLIMGTAMEFVCVGAPETIIRPLWEEFRSELIRLDTMLNRFNADSEVSKVNREEVPAGKKMQMLVDICSRYREKTEGLFDICREGGYDFGGFAKGYALKVPKDMLVRASVGTAFADFGRSSMLALGHHPCGESWKVELVNPYDGSQIKLVDLVDCSMSSSGNLPGYEGHIVNPLNGRACKDRTMSVVTSPDPLDAEVLSTVLMIADEQQLKIIEKNFPDARMDIFEL